MWCVFRKTEVLRTTAYFTFSRRETETHTVGGRREQEFPSRPTHTHKPVYSAIVTRASPKRPSFICRRALQWGGQGARSRRDGAAEIPKSSHEKHHFCSFYGHQLKNARLSGATDAPDDTNYRARAGDVSLSWPADQKPVLWAQRQRTKSVRFSFAGDCLWKSLRMYDAWK